MPHWASSQNTLCTKESFLLGSCNRGCLPEVKQYIGISNGILPYCSVAAATRGQTRRRRVDNTEQVQQRGGAFVSSSSPAQAGGLMLAIGLGRWFARRVRLLVGPSQPSAHHVH